MYTCFYVCKGTYQKFQSGSVKYFHEILVCFSTGKDCTLKSCVERIISLGLVINDGTFSIVNLGSGRSERCPSERLVQPAVVQENEKGLT